MAHKKAGGSSRNGRDSIGKRRGVKRFGGQVVKAGKYSGSPGRNHLSCRSKRGCWQGLHALCSQ